MGIADDLQKIDEINFRIELGRQEVSRIRDRVVEGIKRGETTGDEIDDFMFVSDPSKSREHFYRELKSKVNSSLNEPILVERIRSIPTLRYLVSPDHAVPHHNETNLCMGIVGSPAIFDIENTLVKFGVEKQVSQHKNREGEFKWSLSQRPLNLTLEDIMHAGADDSVAKYLGLPPNDSIILHVGQDAVERYFTQDIQGKGLRNYVPALKLLGHPISKSLNVAYNAEIDTDKNILLLNLEGKLKMYEFNYRSEDADERSAATLKLIKSNLTKAIEFDMHQTPDTRRLQRGASIVSLDVPAYIRGLCERFEVGPYSKPAA